MSRIHRIKNAKFSGYYFYINTNIYGEFQICIIVPLHLQIFDISILKSLFPEDLLIFHYGKTNHTNVSSNTFFVEIQFHSLRDETDENDDLLSSQYLFINLLPKC